MPRITCTVHKVVDADGGTAPTGRAVAAFASPVSRSAMPHPTTHAAGLSRQMMQLPRAAADTPKAITGFRGAKMKILHIAESAQGGVGTYLTEILADQARRYGRDRVRYACTGTERPWKLKAEFLSQRYTTRWGELLNV